MHSGHSLRTGGDWRGSGGKHKGGDLLPVVIFSWHHLYSFLELHVAGLFYIQWTLNSADKKVGEAAQKPRSPNFLNTGKMK